MTVLATNEAALDLFDQHRASVVAALRGAARLAWIETKRPVHIGQIHHVLKQAKYEQDPRVLGATFRGWTAVGWTRITTMQGRQRMVRLFVPSHKE